MDFELPVLFLRGVVCFQSISIFVHPWAGAGHGEPQVDARMDRCSFLSSGGTAFMRKSMVLVVLFFLVRTSSSSNASDKRRENSTHSVFST